VIVLVCIVRGTHNRWQWMRGTANRSRPDLDLAHDALPSEPFKVAT